jgi:hypothetical protein
MAKFIFLDKLSESTINWLNTLQPQVDTDDDLSESILLKKIISFLTDNKDNVSDEHKKYLLELSGFSLDIAQYILKWLPHIKKKLTDDTTEVIFINENGFINEVLDHIFVPDNSSESKTEVANTWLKLVQGKPISKFSWLWNKILSTFLNEDLSTMQYLINDKVDGLVDLDNTVNIRTNVTLLVKHAMNHEGILDALIYRHKSRSIFSLDDYDEKYLTANQWFELLKAHRNNPYYRTQICNILLEPRGFSFSVKSSFAFTALEAYAFDIQHAAKGAPGHLLAAIAKAEELQQQLANQQSTILELKKSAEMQAKKYDEKIRTLEDRLVQLQQAKDLRTPGQNIDDDLFEKVPPLSNKSHKILKYDNDEDPNEDIRLDPTKNNKARTVSPFLEQWVRAISEDGDKKVNELTEEELTEEELKRVYGGKYTQYPQEERSVVDKKFAQKHGEYTLFNTITDDKQPSVGTISKNDQPALADLFSMLSTTMKSYGVESNGTSSAVDESKNKPTVINAWLSYAATKLPENANVKTAFINAEITDEKIKDERLESALSSFKSK